MEFVCTETRDENLGFCPDAQEFAAPSVTSCPVNYPQYKRFDRSECESASKGSIVRNASPHQKVRSEDFSPHPSKDSNSDVFAP